MPTFYYYVKEGRSTCVQTYCQNGKLALRQPGISGFIRNGSFWAEQKPKLVELEREWSKPKLVELEPKFNNLERELSKPKLNLSKKYILENMEKILRQPYQENVSAKKIYRNGKCSRDKVNQKRKLAEK